MRKKKLAAVLYALVEPGDNEAKQAVLGMLADDIEQGNLPLRDVNGAVIYSLPGDGQTVEKVDGKYRWG
jgi:hypothetical protein